MLKDLHLGKKVVGIKQLRKAVQQGQIAKAFFALNADPMLIDPLRALCEETGTAFADVPTMAELGQACGISVGAAAAGLLK